MDTPITIYQSIYNDTARVSNAIITPIQVGRGLTNDDYGILRDDTGDNISHLNRMYGELTGHYWAWKNDHKSAYIGIFHYRRLFIFKSGFENRVNHEGDRVIVHRLDASSEATFGWTEPEIYGAARGQDIILPLRFLVKTDGKNPENCGEHFARNHGEENYREMLRLIETHSPEHMPYAERFFASDTMYLANMFVMRRDLFDAYSAWLFRLLDAVRQRLDCMSFDKYQVRMPAFMAERFFNIYLLRLADIHPELKIKEVPYIFIENNLPPPKPLEIVRDSRRVVPIVTGFDDSYVPCFGACLASLAEFADPHSYYDIIVLADEVSQLHRDLLAAQIRMSSNIGLRYIDMPMEFARPDALNGHFTKATFFRLKLPELLPSHEKVIYIDPDTVMLEDLGSLCEIDISNAYAGAVLDYTMQLQVATDFRIADSFGRMTRQEYWDQHLKLSPQAQRSYFNAGVMVFNLAKIRKDKIIERFEELFWSQRFDLPDQDIMNKAFDGHVVHLDARWNIITQPLEVMARLPFRLYEEYLTARQKPAILHFAGWYLKPWKAQKIDFAEYFWLFSRKSPFYETSRQAFIENCWLDEQRSRLNELEKMAASPWRFYHAIRKSFRRFAERSR